MSRRIKHDITFLRSRPWQWRWYLWEEQWYRNGSSMQCIVEADWKESLPRGGLLNCAGVLGEKVVHVHLRIRAPGSFRSFHLQLTLHATGENPNYKTFNFEPKISINFLLVLQTFNIKPQTFYSQPETFN